MFKRFPTHAEALVRNTQCVAHSLADSRRSATVGKRTNAHASVYGATLASKYRYTKAFIAAGLTQRDFIVASVYTR